MRFTNINTLRNKIKYFDEKTRWSEIEMKLRDEVSNFQKVSPRLVLASKFQDISRYLIKTFNQINFRNYL